MQDHSLHAVTCGSSILGNAGSAQLQEVLDDSSSHHEELSQGQTIHLGEARSPVILPVGVDPHLHDGQDPHPARGSSLCMHASLGLQCESEGIAS